MIGSDAAGRRDVPTALWLGLPLAALAMRFVSPLLGYKRWIFFSREELGFVEIGTVVMLLPAAAMFILLFRRRRELPRGVGWAMLVLAAAALFFAGEEASWGQHYIGFATPKGLVELNRQEEFNLHNWAGPVGRGVFNIFTRLLATLAIVVGGLVLPVALCRWRRRPEARRSPWYWLVPDHRLWPTAALTVLSRVPHKIDWFHALPPDDYLSMSLVGSSGEFKEFCVAMGILLFAMSVYLRAWPAAGAAAPAEPPPDT